MLPPHGAGFSPSFTAGKQHSRGQHLPWEALPACEPLWQEGGLPDPHTSGAGMDMPIVISLPSAELVLCVPRRHEAELCHVPPATDALGD